jgi:hypothetical protein
MQGAVICYTTNRAETPDATSCQHPLENGGSLTWDVPGVYGVACHEAKLLKLRVAHARCWGRGCVGGSGGSGPTVLRAIAIKDGLAASQVAEIGITIVPQVHATRQSRGPSGSLCRLRSAVLRDS